MDGSLHNTLKEISKKKRIYVVLFHLYIILEIANQSRVTIKIYQSYNLNLYNSFSVNFSLIKLLKTKQI